MQVVAHLQLGYMMAAQTVFCVDSAFEERETQEEEEEEEDVEDFEQQYREQL